MKIILVTNICTHYVNKFFELLSKKYDVDFYFTGGQETYWNRKIALKLGNIRGRYLKVLFEFPGIRVMPGLFRLFVWKADIVIKTIDGRFALPFVFLTSKLYRKPFILWAGLWSHPQTFFHKISYVFTKLIYFYSDAIVVYGEHVKEYLIGLGVEPKKIFCAPHSIDNSVFNKPISENQITQLKKELKLFCENTILYVGRFEECKGLDFLIDGLSRINGLNFIVLFIGNGAWEEVLKSRCSELSIKCRFLGHIVNEDLYQYYALADIFVLPSITTKDFKEPWGLVVNEAMNQGCPVVVTDAVGAAAGGLVEDGKNGYVVPERDSLALKVAIENLLGNERLRLEMGKYSRKKIEHWTLEKMVEVFEDAIEFVSGKNERRDK